MFSFGNNRKVMYMRCFALLVCQLSYDFLFFARNLFAYKILQLIDYFDYFDFDFRPLTLYKHFGGSVDKQPFPRLP